MKMKACFINTAFIAITLVAILGAVTGVAALGQTANVKPQVKAALPVEQSQANTTAKPAASVQPALPPELTELEKAKLENLQLKFTLLKQQEKDLQDQWSVVIRSVEKEHPGWTWNPSTGGLLKKP